jgi:hypothetical protein
MSAPEAIRPYLERLTGRIQQNEQFLRAFGCNWRKGPAPCVVGDRSPEPMIAAPLGMLPCPLVDTEACLPAQNWRDWQAAEAERRWAELAPQIGVTLRYRKVSFETSRPTAAIRLVKAHWQHLTEGGALLMGGEPGIGKTHAVVCALRAFPGQSKVFWPMEDLAAELMHGEDKRSVLRSVREVKFLVLDDIGGEYWKPGGVIQAELDGLIVRREAMMLSTLLTTRLEPDQVRTRLSASVRDRLNGKWAHAEWVEGESLR